MTERSKATLQLIGTIFLAALVTVLAKLTLQRVSAFTFNWMQLAVCMLFLSGYTFMWRKEAWPRQLSWQQWGYAAAIGLANFTLVRYFFIAGLDYLPVTTHAFLVNFVGLVTMLLSVIMLNEKPFLIQILGALIALSGVTVFFEHIPSPDELTGIILVAIGVVFLALTNNLIRRFMIFHRQSMSVVMLSTLAIWIGGIPLVVFGLWQEGNQLKLSLTDFSIILANGIFALALTLIVFNKALQVLRSYEASVLASCGLIFVALLAMPLAGEKLAWHNVAGIIIFFIGIMLSQLQLSIKAIIQTIKHRLRHD
jgi:drug/metabolite transporter (DMT)-like permease